MDRPTYFFSPDYCDNLKKIMLRQTSTYGVCQLLWYDIRLFYHLAHV